MSGETGQAPLSPEALAQALQVQYLELERAKLALEQRRQAQLEREFAAQFAFRQAQAVREAGLSSLAEFYAVLQAPAAPVGSAGES